MSKYLKSIPPVKTRGDHSDEFHESNKQIVDMWHKEEEKRKKRYDEGRKKNAEKKAKIEES